MPLTKLNQATNKTALTQNQVRWVIIATVCAAILLFAGKYIISAQENSPGRYGGVSRIDLLYLNGPAPGYEGLRTNGSKTLLVFCDNCTLPHTDTGVIRQSRDITLAKQYALVNAKGHIGPGYAIIDSKGLVRYQTFDENLGQHGGEINRLIRKVE